MLILDNYKYYNFFTHVQMRFRIYIFLNNLPDFITTIFYTTMI